MKITLVTPARPGSHHGNRHTAARWATLLRGLGHHVRVVLAWDGAPADLMIALHARRSHDSVSRFAAAHPDRPLVLVLTGTDLYRDIKFDAGARHSLRLATRLVVLQEQGFAELGTEMQRKARVIYQSARAARRPRPLQRCFEIVVSGHLREEKDPFRCAMAAARLPPQSRIRIVHIGAAMSAQMEEEARSWSAREPRYAWLGSLPHGKALRVLARSRLMVISSRMEGGANVVSEALAAGTPVIASRIPGNIGMLGRGYAGYYPVGDERALARLLARAESDREFYRRLASQCRSRRARITPRSERAALKALLAELPGVRPAR